MPTFHEGPMISIEFVLPVRTLQRFQRARRETNCAPLSSMYPRVETSMAVARYGPLTFGRQLVDESIKTWPSATSWVQCICAVIRAFKPHDHDGTSVREPRRIEDGHRMQETPSPPHFIHHPFLLITLLNGFGLSRLSLCSGFTHPGRFEHMG